MIAWDTRWPLSKQTHCSKQTILHIGSRKNCRLNARKTTNPKVFDLHRKYSSKNIMKQMDPREPELSDCFSKSVWGLLPTILYTCIPMTMTSGSDAASSGSGDCQVPMAYLKGATKNMFFSMIEVDVTCSALRLAAVRESLGKLLAIL